MNYSNAASFKPGTIANHGWSGFETAGSMTPLRRLIGTQAGVIILLEAIQTPALP